MSQQYWTQLTESGRNKVLAAIANQTQIKISHFAVGDGFITEQSTNIVSSQYRGEISMLIPAQDNTNQIEVVAVVPGEVGGFYVREAALYTDDGEPFALIKYPETYKPKDADNATAELGLKAVIDVVQQGAISEKIDPSRIYALREWVDHRIETTVSSINDNLARHGVGNRVSYQSDLFHERTFNIKISGKTHAFFPDLPASACDILVFGLTNATATETAFVGRFKKEGSQWQTEVIHEKNSGSNAPAIKVVDNKPAFFNHHTHPYTFAYKCSVACQNSAKAKPFDFHAKGYAPQYLPVHSHRDFTKGTLIETSLNYAVATGDSWYLEIRGNAYNKNLPLNVKVQGYLYQGQTVHTSGVTTGYKLSGLISMERNGKLCFWFPRQDYWQGFEVRCISSQDAGHRPNLVTAITNADQPSGSKIKAVPMAHTYDSWNTKFKDFDDGEVGIKEDTVSIRSNPALSGANNTLSINPNAAWNTVEAKGDWSFNKDIHLHGDLKLSGDDSYIWTDKSETGFFGLYDPQNDVNPMRYENGKNFNFKADIDIEKSNAWLTLKSSHHGGITQEQAAGVSIGESGRTGAASVHLTYNGDGYGYLGMGALGADNIPQNWALKMYYLENWVRFRSKVLINGASEEAVGLSSGPEGSLKVESSHGFVDIGMQNSNWCHFATDSTNGFHFSKDLSVKGEIYAGQNYNSKVYHTSNKPTAADVGAVPNRHLLGNISLDANKEQSKGVVFEYLSSGGIHKPPGTDHALQTLSYNKDWATQMASDWRTNKWFVRNKMNGQWGGWAEVYTSHMDSITTDGKWTYNESAKFNENISVEGDLRFTGPDSYIWTPNRENGFTGIFDPHTGVVAIRYTNGGQCEFGTDIKIAKNTPWLNLHSSELGNMVSQAAGVSIGESGRGGGASLHISYTGDGYSHLGMGALGTDSIATNWAMQMHYENTWVRFRSEVLIDGEPGEALSLRSGAESTLKVQSKHGFVDIGPQNNTWCHFNTDATHGFHLSKDVSIKGEIFAGPQYNNKVYHTGHKPSAADVGALGKSDKAADSSLLEGRTKAQVIGDVKQSMIADRKFYHTGYKPTSAEVGAVPDKLLSTNISADANATHAKGVTFEYLDSSATNKPEGTDHALQTLNYNEFWATQMASDWRTNKWFVRNKKSGLWGSWAEVYTTQSKPTAEDVGAQPFSSKLKEFSESHIRGWGQDFLIRDKRALVGKENSLYLNYLGDFNDVAVNSDITIDNGDNTTVNIIANDAGAAVLNVCSDGGQHAQSTGIVYVGQSKLFGGGIEYNGDSSPVTSGGGSDHLALFRRASGKSEWTARNYYNSNNWQFRSSILIGEGSNQANLSGTADKTLKVTSQYGEVAIGAKNKQYCHFMTDLPQFHMNRDVTVRGEIFAGLNYNQKVYHEGHKPTAAEIGAVAKGESINLTNKEILWSENSDGAAIGFVNTHDGQTDSHMYFRTRDNNNEHFRFLHRLTGSSGDTQWAAITKDGIKEGNTLLSSKYLTKEEFSIWARNHRHYPYDEPHFRSAESMALGASPTALEPNLVKNSGSLTPNTKHYLIQSTTFTLPNTSSLREGTSIVVSKTMTAKPQIKVASSNESILTMEGSSIKRSSFIALTEHKTLTFILNGQGDWEVHY